MIAEIDQQSEPYICCLEIVDHLCLVFWRYLLDRFQFEDDFPEADKIGFVGLFERFTFVVPCQVRLGNKRNASCRQLSFQTFLIDRLQKSTTHLAINVKDRALNLIALLFEKYLS